MSFGGNPSTLSHSNSPAGCRNLSCCNLLLRSSCQHNISRQSHNLSCFGEICLARKSHLVVALRTMLPLLLWRHLVRHESSPEVPLRYHFQNRAVRIWRSPVLKEDGLVWFIGLILDLYDMVDFHASYWLFISAKQCFFYT